MIICNANCPIFHRCKEKIPQQVCQFDLGFPEDKDIDMAEILDNLTY